MGFDGPNIRMTGDWYAEDAKSDFSEMKLETFTENKVLLGKHGQPGCDSLFRLTAEDGEDVFIGIENEHSGDKASTELTVQDITTKWELFNNIINNISRNAKRFLVFIARRNCQQQLDRFLMGNPLAPEKAAEFWESVANVRQLLNGREKRILVIDNSTLREYLGDTCHAVFFPYDC